MKKQLTRISILQSSKIILALYALFGVLYMIPGVFMATMGEGQIRMMGIIYCFMPILMSVFGFIFFAIAAALYNLLAKWLGGIEVEVTTVE